MNYENLNIWCWIIPILIGIISAIFGYLIGKSGAKPIENSTQLKALENENTELKRDLAACTKSLAIENPEVNSLSSNLMEGSIDDTTTFNADMAKTAFGKKIKENDLKVIEGIGPKIEGLFHNYNINTWQMLSETPVAKCQEVLDSGGDRYKMHNPASWPMQAKMCHQGKWKELRQWQDQHKAGKF